METVQATVVTFKAFHKMTKEEFTQAARAIITTSSSEEEILRRLKTELQYPYRVTLGSYQGANWLTRGIQSLLSKVGLLTMANGALVTVLLEGTDGRAVLLR